MSVSELNIPTGYFSAGNMWSDPGNINIAHRHMTVEIGAEAAQFLEKGYINGIFVAVCYAAGQKMLMCLLYYISKLFCLGFDLNQGYFSY